MTQRPQNVLPNSFDGKTYSNDNLRAPSMHGSQAFGFKGKIYIEYVIVDTTFGQPDESGENLSQYYVMKKEQFQPNGSAYDAFAGHIDITKMQLFVNDKGDAYRTWKGKLKGRPVCNFTTGAVYYYGNLEKVLNV